MDSGLLYPPRPYASPSTFELDPTNPYFQPSPSFARRFSTNPQIGYYDLITGEYRYRNEQPQNYSPLLSNYAGETEPPMCEDACRCCQMRLPFNCLTISLLTSLMLLLMFSLFKMLLGSKSKIDMSLFENMIALTAILTLVFLVLAVLRHLCLRHSRIAQWSLCRRCKFFGSLVAEVFRSSGPKHISYSASRIQAEEQFV